MNRITQKITLWIGKPYQEETPLEGSLFYKYEKENMPFLRAALF
uniref:Uncharacterized protein n=1 Tax=uncultured bacterium contig00026 TaxID=1181515 RepID=A0A806KJM0_9BACT|nr:hypothetical protein [uncultured bacterium contig00026]